MLHNNKPSFSTLNTNHDLSRSLAEMLSAACDRACRGKKLDVKAMRAMLNDALSAVTKEEVG